MMNNTAMNTTMNATFTPATIADFPRSKGEKAPQLRTRKFEIEQQIAALTRELHEVNDDLQETAEKEDNDFKRHIEVHNFLSAMAIATNGKIIADPNGTGVRNILSYSNAKAIQDHEGNWFATIVDMCDWYGINKETYKSRIRIGWSLEDTLTTPVRKTNHKKIPKEVKENGINPGTYHYRKAKGYPEEVCVLSAREFANWKREQKAKAKANEVKKVGELMNIG